ncbi:hypothetical protein GCM10009682_56130 [Luedemannella flava]|uniref:DUF397 domain-containing protein n=1 Tax=Luedemannella flava TaxID=349316 RepID=A0ABN2MKU4_9ACTN
MPLVSSDSAAARAIAPSWVRSTRCHTANCCVEVSLTDPDRVLLRSSVAPERGVLSFSPDSWSAFLAAVREGDFDR